MVAENPEKRVGKGTVFVKVEVCKGCAYCIEFCPADCLRFSRNYNAKGYHYPILARPEDCTGCNTCGQFCPDYAIMGMRYRDIDALEAAKNGAKGTADGRLVDDAGVEVPGRKS